MSAGSSAFDVSDKSSSSYLDQIIYLSPATHPDSGESIIVFSLAALSTLPDSVSDDELFTGLLERCRPWVGEEGEKSYVLVILASEGEATARARARGSGFWVWRWMRIPRSFRKNLKRMYIVHPTRFTKTILQVVLPFLSPKSYRKIYPLESLILLNRIHGVSLAGMHLTLPLLLDESRVMAERPDLFPLAHKERYPQPKEPVGWFSGFTSMVGAAAGYLPYGSTPALGHSEEIARDGCYGRSAEELVSDCGGVPKVMDELREAILYDRAKVEGIFRGTPGAALRPPLIALLSFRPENQPVYPWHDIARSDPFLPPKLLMRVFASAPSPYIPSEVYPIVRQIRSPSDIPRHLFPALSPSRVTLLSHMIHTFNLLSTSESTTRMTARNFAICFAPDLIRGDDPIDDLEMCLEPGRTLPPALAAQRKQGGARGEGECCLVSVLEMWIRDVGAIEGACANAR